MEGRRSSGDRSGLYGYTCKFIYTCPSILEGVHSALQYRDLYDMLYRAAINAGARITYGATVTSVHANPPRVELHDGTVLKADMVVGADGPRSTVREAVGGWSSEEVPEGHSAYV